jgi:ABC-type branched-subunit amino acid transport system ATPase component
MDSINQGRAGDGGSTSSPARLTDDHAPLMEVRGLSKAFGGNVVVHDVSFTVLAHQITGLIGPNGAGKTTVFNLITGFIQPDGGYVRFYGRDLGTELAHQIASTGITRTFQELRLFESLSVRDNVVLAMKDQPGERVASLFLRWRRSDKYERDCRARAQELLQFVGLDHAADAAASDLSYGQQKRLALARALASDGDLICLDEPTAGLDPEMLGGVVRLIKQLVERGRTILLVEHNLEVVAEVCNTVLFMDQGRLVRTGPPETVLNDPRVHQGYLGI